MNNIKLVELLEIIKERPAMYLNRHNIVCLKSFLDGWYFRNTQEDVDIELLNNFTNWLKEYYGLNVPFNWEKIILLYAQDEAKALDMFFELFFLFLSENK